LSDPGAFHRAVSQSLLNSGLRARQAESGRELVKSEFDVTSVAGRVKHSTKNSSKGNMRYVILRDDDTNALTPVECLEQLYRPFLDRGLPVNLAAIPNVRTDTLSTDGALEKYLFAKRADTPLEVPIANSGELVRYLHENPGFHLLQHGCDHSLFEFDSNQGIDIDNRLDQGAAALMRRDFATAKHLLLRTTDSRPSA